MPQPNDQTGPGDSTPNFDWLRDHETSAGEPWRAPGQQDSTLDMLPPEEQPQPPGAASSEEPPPTIAYSAPPLQPAPPPVTEEAEPSRDSRSAEAPPAERSAPTATPVPPDPATASATAAATAATKSLPAAGSARPQPTSATPTADRDRLILIGLISYASAVTLILLYLFFAGRNPSPHQLESLPDVPPLEVSKGEVMRLIEADADMPPGHTLRLGESRRFGNILVEPLRVTREPIEFVHFSNQANLSKPKTAPVLKLWVRFTNVSDDQTIAPLDAGLLYVRTLRDSGRFRANQFVATESEKSEDGQQVMVFDHPTTSEWDMAGQQLGAPLPPGDSVEIFIPTEEDGLNALTGDLVWRLHFRKGYSPRGYGVTTVVEIAFDSSQIQSKAG